MIGVYSFWSKPAQLRGSQYKTHGGFPSRRHLALSWMLSVYLAKAHFGHLKLVTDSEGEAFLIGQLGLPFDEVSTELDALDHLPGDLWAIGKLHAYRQNQPFIHLDHDAYMFRRPDWLAHTPLFCQYFESANVPLYYQQINEFAKPDYHSFEGFEAYRARPIGSQWPVNAGVMGGTDWAFFADYAAEALRFVEHNLEAMLRSPIPLNDTNVFWEQYLFAAMAHARGKNIVSYAHQDGWAQLTHLVGGAKALPQNAERFEPTLLQIFPFLKKKVGELGRE